MGVVVFVDWVGVRPAGGAVVLAGDGLTVEAVVLGVEGEGFDAEVLDAAALAGFGAAEAGREAVVPVAGLDNTTHRTKQRHVVSVSGNHIQTLFYKKRSARSI